jgi:hypothetical protein
MAKGTREHALVDNCVELYRVYWLFAAKLGVGVREPGDTPGWQ